MKKFLLAASISFMLTTSAEVKAQYIPDAQFASVIVYHCPTCIDAYHYLTADAQTLTFLYVNPFNVTDLTGVEGFTNLQTLSIGDNPISIFPASPPNLLNLSASYSGLSTLPPLPSTLTVLSCQVCSLTSLPALPPSLISLNVYQNQITSLPSLPSALKYLYCAQNELTYLPTLPDSLQYLYCNLNQLTILPTLPESLQYLDCSNNSITSIPNFPSSCDTVNCRINNLTQLPALPPAMKSLRCSENNLTDLPALPSSLIYLTCYSNNLDSLPELPTSLFSLDAGNNQLQELPALPTGLRGLSCNDNLLTSLPTLTDSLEGLECDGNQITIMPPLPQSLYLLDCGYNPLVHLPALASVGRLFAEGCGLTDLPPFPASLYELYLGWNNITSLPDLPPSLSFLEIRDNPISCLPFLPPSLDCIDLSNTNITCYPNIVPYLYYDCNYYDYLPVCDAGNGNGCIAYPAISGNVYFDINSNGMLDYGEFPVNNIVVKAIPGNYVGISDATGSYKIVVPLASTDTARVAAVPVYYNLPSTAYTITFDSTSGQVSYSNDFGILPMDSGANLEVTLPHSQFRHGFDCNIYVSLRNVGTTVLDGELALTIDPALTLISTNPGADVAGNVITWTYNDLFPWETRNYYVTVNTPQPTGTIIHTEVTGTVNDSIDIDLSNNSRSDSSIVVNSFDPNDKAVSDAILTPDDLDNGKYLEYTIHFQNTGTAPATFINVVDTLSDKLDASTFEMIAASHHYEITLANDLTKANHPVFVKWLFNNIQLPDSSTDFAGSQGFVMFRIKPKNDLLIGDQIQNTAEIYFDYNEPVLTNTTVTDITIANAIVSGSNDFFGVSAFPNPAANTTRIHFNHVNSSQLAFQITDALGTIMMEKIISVPHESFDVNLDMTKFHRGVYVITVKSVGGVRVMKLVKS